MEAIADNVIGLLGSTAAKELGILGNLQDDLETMRRKVTGIRAVLRDAEKKATKSEAINDWLQKLKDVLHDAEDLLDAYSAEELAREVMTKGKMAKEVRIFFSKSNRIACAHKMGRKIWAIRRKLDEIYDEKNPLQLQQSSSDESHDWGRDYPCVSEQDVVGRDEERKHIVSTLLNPDVKSDISVVPIVGIGGSGKTTFAQLVFNDVADKNHFEPMMWVCVSDETHALSNNMLAQKIIGQQTSAHEAFKKLRENIEGKLFLLVLDDVWNIKDRGEWLKLENLFRAGRKGSMIIVTTRNLEVANTMGTYHPLSLKDLDEDNSWKLFCMVAFQGGEEPDDREWIRIGKDIVGKCAGVPLAIRTIGSLLYGKDLSEFSSFRDQELANIGYGEDNEDNRIMSTLKLSYDHLPSHLKNCFTFCSVFPKDYEIERNVLIQLWIAEGFVQPLDQKRRLEDVGDECFKQLLQRCLLQDVRRDDFGNIKWCKMHDLIHDLALSITKKEHYIVTSGRIEEANFGDEIRHVSSYFFGYWKFQFGNVKTKKVRTILSPIGHWEFIQSHSLSRYCNPIGRSTTSLPKHLRVLDLSRQLLEIPKSIRDLKHLRYLDLTGNNRLKTLPQEITKLHNLLSLILNGCKNLIELPRDIKRLVRLRHLELDDCDSLICMPCGLGSLTNLQILTTFVVDKRSGGGGKISELLGLIQLKGGLEIRNLKRQQRNIEGVESSKFLLHMQYLQKLKLMWGEKLCKEDEHKDDMILDALEPPHTIKTLHILGFHGKCLLDWIGRLTSLQELRLCDCASLASLPESIGNLTSLLELDLYDCTYLTSLPESIGSLTLLRELRLNGCTSLASLSESIGSLTLLRELRLNGCTSLALLPKSIGSLTSLRKLSLNYCTCLASLPESIGNLTSLLELHLYDCTSLTSLPESIRNLTSLLELHLYDCTSLASLPESIGSLTLLRELRLNGCTSLASLLESIGSLTLLRELRLNGCTSLASLPESIGSLTSLLEIGLYDCTSLASLPESIGSLTSLRELCLHDCTSLASLPESIGSLTSLQELILHGCTYLTSLPESIGSITSLRELRLNGCTSLASLPESIGNLTSLLELDLYDCTYLASLPESIGSLTLLRELRLNGCTSLASLPESIGNLTSLLELGLYGCTYLASLPESIGSFTSLPKLNLWGCTSLSSLPESIGNLTSLLELHLYDCTSLASLPESIGSLTSLRELCLFSCTSLASLPESIGNLTSLLELYLYNCTSLASLPESIGSLTLLHELHLIGCTYLASLPESIESLTSLRELRLYGCTSLASLPNSMKSLTSL